MAKYPYLGWSSHVYPLEATDVAALPDYADVPFLEGALPADDIIILIRPDGPDVLVRGREKVNEVVSGGEVVSGQWSVDSGGKVDSGQWSVNSDYSTNTDHCPLTTDHFPTVNVRIVFVPSIPKWNLLATLIRVWRNHYRYHGTVRYHISASAIRRLGLERTIRSVENPQRRKGENRVAAMEKLMTSLRTEGFREDCPIHIMLCRTKGLYDSVRQGHHRISACLACGVDRMAVFFSAAGALPRELGLRKEPPIS